MKTPQPVGGRTLGPRSRPIVAAALVLATFVVYWRVVHHGFIVYDDEWYIVDNLEVRQGLSAAGIAWAFTTCHASNWHPLSWLSHMADVELFGMNAGAHHLVNVLLHALNSVLLFVLLDRATGARGRSALVAALFSLHPLHVESVAWVAERKDLLSTFFFLVSLHQYVGFVQTRGQRGGRLRYGLSLGAFALGLLAKPMIVTLPLILLLLDYWPLQRYRDGPVPGDEARLTFGKALVEKVPFLMLSVASSAVTIFAQAAGGAIGTLARYSFSSRIENALIAYVRYLGKTALPVDLAVFYPRPESFPAWQPALAALALAAATWLAFSVRRRSPHVLFGWLWFLVALLPVIGLVQVGRQALADRYMYMPLVGLLVPAVWWVGDALRGRSYARSAALALSAVAVVTCLFVSWRQLDYWRDSLTLFRHADSVTQGNYVAHANIGMVLGREGRLEEAAGEITEALRLSPREPLVHFNLGQIRARQGRYEEAIASYLAAIDLNASMPDVQLALGIALARQGRFAEALDHFLAERAINSRSAQAYYYSGVAYDRLGKPAEAIGSYSEALRLDPAYAEAHFNLGLVLSRLERCDEALVHLSEAVRLRPDSALAHQAADHCRGRGPVVPPSPR